MEPNGATKQLAVASKKQSLVTLTGKKYTREQIELLKRTVCRGASDDELSLFLYVAERSQLDPFARQIHAVKRWNSDVNAFVMVAQTAIDGYRLIAERTGHYAPGREPTFAYDQDGKLTSATAYVFKAVGDRWFEVAASARYDEYVAKKKDGTPNSMWTSKPHVMLAKCAEALALRRAFPAELGGIYAEEEIESTNATAPVEARDRSSASDEKLTKEEAEYLRAEITKSGIALNDVQAFTLSKFGKKSAGDLTKAEADAVVRMLRNEPPVESEVVE